MTRRTRRSATPPPLRPLTGTRLAEALIGGWRPLQRLDVDGFSVLRSRGVTRRAHSILALDAPDSEPELAAALDRVESLVARAGNGPRTRILDGVTPRLDPLLEARGDESAGDSEILERELTGALPRPHPSAVISTGALDEDWFDAAWALAPREGEGARESLHDILAGTPAIQVRLPAGEVPDAAVGRAALVDVGKETLVVLNMIAVDPAHRRRGLAAPCPGRCWPSPPCRGRAARCSRSRPRRPLPAPSIATSASAGSADTTTAWARPPPHRPDPSRAPPAGSFLTSASARAVRGARLLPARSSPVRRHA